MFLNIFGFNKTKYKLLNNFKSLYLILTNLKANIQTILIL